jgi:hypothetical protein
MEINDIVENDLVEYLQTILDNLFWYSVTNENNIIEINGKSKKTDNSNFILIKVGINHNHREVYIPNIFLPLNLRKKNIGLKMISTVFNCAKKHNYDLALVDMTDSFYERMLKRGAQKCNLHDALQITDETDLTSKY